MKNLFDGIALIYNIFAKDTFLLSKVLDVYEYIKKLNFDSGKIVEWAFQWEMQFNPDLNKEGHEVVSLIVWC